MDFFAYPQMGDLGGITKGCHDSLNDCKTKIFQNYAITPHP